jgi:hypothetical protein
MTGSWLEEALELCGLRSAPTFPRDLATEATECLHITLEERPHLTSDGVQAWLAQQGLSPKVPGPPRPLHGCMVAKAGFGLLFYDSTDSECEQRFTLAHEVSHFVLDHLLPRARALQAFGEEIRPVLDGKRPATLEESLSSVLSQIPLGVQVKLMDRSHSGAICTGNAAESEWRADRLALELLAPAELAKAMLEADPGEEAEARLASRFGLPAQVARTYVHLLRRQHPPARFSILEFLGEDGR